MCGLLAPSVRADGTPTTPDTSLKSPVAYRRLPGGQRILDETNLLGIPKGTAVPQLVLWERFRDKATKGATRLFLSPTHFARGRSRGSSGISATSTIGSTFSTEEIRYCEERLRESYPGYPSLHDLTFDTGRDLWVARFFNSPLDKNPSSVMLENYTTIQINGSHHVDPPEALIFPLGQMMDIWVTRYRREADLDAMTLSAAQAANGNECGRDDGRQDRARFEPDFYRSTRAASDGATVRMALETYLPDLIERERICLLRGPEGVAKTSSIMSRHPEIMSRINRPGLALYAFADYKNAQEKCDQFNSLGHDGIVGVVWPSFSRVYKELCEEIGIAEIKFADAAKSGFQSIWSEVERKQSQIIKAMRRRHADLWHQVGNAKPVVFTVHDVAHRWADRNRTRRLWSRTFWDEEADQEQQFEETKLAFLIHDEIKTATFVDLTPASTLGWVQLLRSENPAIWRENHFSLQMKAIEDHAEKHGWPDGQEIDLNQARRLMGIQDWTAVTTADTGEYAVRACDDPEKDIYSRRHGKTWHVRPRKWWRDGVHHVAPRIILLTTEFVPTAVAQAAHPEIHVLNFETNGVPPDEVELQVERDVTAANLPAILQDRIPMLRADSGQDWSAVSNKSGGLDLQFEIEALTHMAARGSNRLIGRNILQTATFMSQSQYEELQALNAWIGRRDLVLMTHIDEINQSCGRNLRFRRQGRERHILLMNRRLYGLLDTSGMFGALRYGLTLHMDNDARKNSRRNAA